MSDKPDRKSKNKLNNILGNVRATLSPLERAEQLSKEMIPTLPNGQWFIGLVGVKLHSDLMAFGDGLMKLRKVINPPGIVHVCRAANLRTSDYMGVGRYSPFIEAELILFHPDDHDSNNLLQVGWHIVALIKILGFAHLIAPSVATSSWDAINAIKDQTIIVQHVNNDYALSASL